MKVASCLSALVLLLAPSVPAFAENPQGEHSLPEPSEQHKLLARSVGSWTAEMKMHMAGPDQPPVIMPGKEVNTLMPGGLWILQAFHDVFEGRGQRQVETRFHHYL